jgi:hypothetical protein
MENIPVSFEIEGKNCNGRLVQVAGAGGNSVFHLMDNKNFYCGRLRYSDFIKDWVFDPTPKTQELEKQAYYFGDVVMAWYE